MCTPGARINRTIIKNRTFIMAPPRVFSSTLTQPPRVIFSTEPYY